MHPRPPGAPPFKGPAVRCDRHLIPAVLLVFGSASDAWAYIDPGTGSYLFQLVIGGGLAALYTARRYWSTLKAKWLTRSRPSRRRDESNSFADGVD